MSINGWGNQRVHLKAFCRSSQSPLMNGRAKTKKFSIQYQFNEMNTVK